MSEEVSRNPDADPTAQQYGALLEVSESIASHRDLSELFHDLVQRLHGVVSFEFLNLVLHDPERNVMRLHILVSSRPVSLPTGMELPVDESPAGWVCKTQHPLIVNNLEAENRFPVVRRILFENGVKSFCALHLNTALRRLGALGFGSLREGAYTEADVVFMQRVAAQVAVAVDNALTTRAPIPTSSNLLANAIGCVCYWKSIMP